MTKEEYEKNLEMQEQLLDVVQNMDTDLCRITCKLDSLNWIMKRLLEELQKPRMGRW